MTALAVLAALVAGCGSNSTTPTTGQISATWSVTEDGAATTCAAEGGVTVEIQASPQGGGAAIVRQFTCAQLTGTTQPLPAATYSVQLRLLDSGGAELGASSTVTVTVTAGQTASAGAFVFAFVSPPLGQIMASWSITKGGAASDCATVGGTTVEIVSGPGNNVDVFNCADLGGTTDPLPVGNYLVLARLLDNASAQLATTSAVPVAVTAGQVTDAGNFVLAVP